MIPPNILPGEVDVPDQFGERLRFEEGTSQSLPGAGDEDLVQGLD